jgi:hypothetical protein
MATHDWGGRPSLGDAMKTIANGRYTGFANVLIEQNPMLRDLPVVTGNGILSHEGARVSSLPTPDIVDVAEGWESKTVEFDKFKEVISIFRMRLDVPRDILDLHPDKATFRANMEDACAEGFGQGVINHLIYGTSVGAGASNKFDGLGTWRTTPDATDPLSVTNGDYATFDGGGSGSGTMSFWLLQPGYRKVYLVTPANDNSGFQQEDKGEVEKITNDAAYVAGTADKKTRYDVRTEFVQKLGLVIEDERAVARIRNVETTRSSFTDDSIFELVMQAETEVFRGAEPVFMYVNARAEFILKAIASHKGNVQYDKNNPYNVPMLRIGNIFIRRCDALLKTETAVSAA